MKLDTSCWSFLASTLLVSALVGPHSCWSEEAAPSKGATWWPQFRGPSGDGIAANQNPPIEFGEDQNVLWRTDVVGKGWSSPVVADNVVYLTTAIERIPTEQERLELLRQTENEEKKFKSLAIAKAIELKLMMLDLDSGSLLKTIDLATVEKPDAIHSLNSYASPTPVVDGQRIFCHFGTYGTFCLDRTSGETVWSRVMPLKHAVGPGSSPFVYGDKLILIQDGMEKQYVIALDKATGAQIWKTNRPPMRASNGDQKKSYCTPISTTDSLGREQLICPGSQWIVGLDPATGKELWRADHGDGFSLVPRPVMHGDHVIFATGFGKPQLWAVDITGSGDVTDSHVRWTVAKGMPQKPSPLIVDDLIYVVVDSGIATCLRASDGSEVWKERLGGTFSASPLFAGGMIYLANHDGEVFIIKPGETFDLVRTNQLNGQIMASPVPINESLLIRTDQALYRF